MKKLSGKHFPAAVLKEVNDNMAMEELQQVQELEKELAELKRQNAITAMRSEARKMLDEKGINLPDDLIQNIVAEDADTTKTNVEAFAKAYKEAVQAAVKEALKGNTPQSSRSDAKGITKEQILAVKDRAERQKLMAENPELFARR